MRTLKERRKAAAFHNTEPTMTDQSAVANTDLNVIINQFLKTGRPQNSGIPRYGDFTEIPNDLRSIIEMSRSMQRRRRELPPQLRDMPVEELLALTPDDIKEILTPPADKPVETKDEK